MNSDVDVCIRAMWLNGYVQFRWLMAMCQVVLKKSADIENIQWQALSGRNNEIETGDRYREVGDEELGERNNGEEENEGEKD